MAKKFSTLSFLSFILFLAAVPSLSSIQAQDLHIHYDVAADSLRFLRDGKPVRDASVRKGGQVQLHVENYNNYLYDLKVNVKDEPPVLADRADAGKAVDGIPFMSMLLKPGGAMASMPLLDLFGGGRFGFGQSGMALEPAQEKQLRELESALNAALRQVQQVDRTLVEQEAQLAKDMQALELEDFAAAELQRIPLDPALSPATIRRLAAEYATVLFGDSDPQRIGVDQVMARQDRRAHLEEHLQGYDESVRDYRMRHRQLEELDAAVRVRAPEQLTEIRSGSERVSATSRERLKALEANQVALRASLDERPSLSAERLLALRTRYIALMENSFASSSSHAAAGDMRFELTLVPGDSLRKSGLRDRRLPSVPVRVYGGMSFASSIGLGLQGFFTPSRAYFVQNGVIRSSVRDAYVPLVGSFLHFFAPGRGQLSWGGSIGAGIPLVSTDGLRSASLLLGPSVLIGNGSRIVLSAGLMGGQTDRPGQDLSEGDPFPADPSLLPIDRVFRLGAFFSVTFNLLKAG